MTIINVDNNFMLAGFIAAYPAVFAAWSVSESIYVSHILSEKIKRKRTSSNNFNKFMKVMNHKDMPMELKLEVWRLIILKVISLENLIKLLKNIKKMKSLENIIKKELKLSLLMYPFDAATSLRLIRQWSIEFKGYPYQTITKKQLKRLLDFMDSHKLQFESIEYDVNYGSPRVQISDNDYSERSLDRICSACQNVSFIDVKPEGYYADRHPTSLVPSRITTLRIFPDDAVTPLTGFSNLKEITLESVSLVDESIIRKLSDINTYQKNLEILKVEFEYVLSQSEENINRLIRHCKLLCDFVKKYSKIKWEFICKQSGKSLISTKSKIKDNAKLTDIYSQFKTIQNCFTSIDIPLIILSEVSQFTRLETLLVKDCLAHKDDMIVLNNSSLKSLKINGCFWPFLELNLKGVPHLETLELDSCYVANKTFTTLCSSIKTIKLTDSNIVGNTMTIPHGLKYLKLYGTYQSLGFNLGSPLRNHFDLKLTLRWSINSFHNSKIQNIIKECSGLIKEIKIEPDDSLPRYCTLSRTYTPIMNRLLDGSSYLIEFPEIVQGPSCFKYYQRVFELDVVNDSRRSESDILGDIAMICANSFQNKDLLKDQPGLLTNAQTSFYRNLSSGFKKSVWSSDYTLTFFESKCPFPSLDPAYTGISPRSL